MKSYSMKQWMNVTAISLVVSCLAGCAGFNTTTTAPVAMQGVALQGKVYGGQQPIAGAAMALYAAGYSGYGSTNTNLLTSIVLSDSHGMFNITGDYNCTPGQQMYLVATGGDPGGGANNNEAIMAALGDCANLSSSTTINLNEVTTVGSVFALAPFMSSITSVSTSPTNASGLAHAFASVNKLVNIGTGGSPGTALPAGAVAPSNEIYQLANVLASCINSQGGVAGDGTACGKLFSFTTPPGGIAPTNTIQAALNIAQHPTLNVASLYQLQIPESPFSVQMTGAPNDWSLAITYSTGGFNSPQSTTVDAGGNIWVANSGNNSVTVLSSTGAPLPGSPFTGNGLTGPTAVAIDAEGNGWIANTAGATVSAFTANGGPLNGSPFNGSGTVSAPRGIAIDAPGNIWIANHGNSSITELSSTGNYLQQVSSGTTAPGSVAVNPK